MVKFTQGDGSEGVNVPLIQPLYDDLVECEKLFESQDSQFVRRAFVRSSFAFLEANTWCMSKQILGIYVGTMAGSLNVLKIALLSDQVGRVDSTGRMSAEPARQPFANYLAFVLRTYAELADYDPAKLFGDNGWNDLKNSLKVRHRITHPKEEKELSISDEEIHTLRRSMTWYINCLFHITNASIQKFGSRTFPPMSLEDFLE